MGLTTYFCDAFQFCFGAFKRTFCSFIFRVFLCFRSSCALCQSFITWQVALLYAITFLLILPNLLRNVRHSIFDSFVDGNALLEATKCENSHRIVQAETYFSSLNRSAAQAELVEHAGIASTESVTVALTIISVSRNRHEIDSYEPKYLTQTAWRFHALLEKWRSTRRSLHIPISICNVDSDVASYNEANALSKFIPMFSRFNQKHVVSVHPLEKEKQDYVFCLRKLLATYEKAEYVFLVEDDALPMDNAFEVLEQVLTKHVERSYSCGEYGQKPTNVAFVKFYHPEWLLDFISFQPERLPELVSYAVLLSTLLTVAYLGVTCRFQAIENRDVTNQWKKMFLFSLAVTLACGRTTLSEWRRLASRHFYSYTPAPSCCTQALLFPRSSALLTANYLSNAMCSSNFGKDSVLDMMLEDLQMTAYLVQPNSFQHIGLYSSIRRNTVNPFLI